MFTWATFYYHLVIISPSSFHHLTVRLQSSCNHILISTYSSELCPRELIKFNSYVYMYYQPLFCYNICFRISWKTKGGVSKYWWHYTKTAQYQEINIKNLESSGTQHNETQHNDIQHKRHIWYIQHKRHSAQWHSA